MPPRAAAAAAAAPAAAPAASAPAPPPPAEQPALVELLDAPVAIAHAFWEA
jgi:hypothetical protein